MCLTVFCWEYIHQSSSGESVKKYNTDLKCYNIQWTILTVFTQALYWDLTKLFLTKVVLNLKRENIERTYAISFTNTNMENLKFYYFVKP